MGKSGQNTSQAHLGEADPTTDPTTGLATGQESGAESPDPPPSMLPTGLAIFGFAILALTMLRAARKKGRARNAGPSTDPRERIERLRESAKRQAVDEYKSEATALTRALAVQLDAKAEALEQLIAQADDRLSRLGGAIDLGDGKGGSAPIPMRRAERDESNAEAIRPEVFRLADEGFDPIEIAQRLEQPIGQVRLMLALRRA